LQLRLRLLGFGEPGVQIGHPFRRDRVPLAVRTRPRLDAHQLHEPVALELGERAVDLAELDRLRRAEAPVVGLLEVVAVAARPLEQPEQGVRDGHTAHYTQQVYTL